MRHAIITILQDSVSCGADCLVPENHTSDAFQNTQGNHFQFGKLRNLFRKL